MKKSSVQLMVLLSLSVACFFSSPLAHAQVKDKDYSDETLIEPAKPTDPGVKNPKYMYETEEQAEYASEADRNRAKIVIIVNKANSGWHKQSVTVYREGEQLYHWLVSTGREIHEVRWTGRDGKKHHAVDNLTGNYDDDVQHIFTSTPTGRNFHPQKLEQLHHSNAWDADMPWAIFFSDGIALHSTPHTNNLGHRASGGCVRLHPKNAKTLYMLVSKYSHKDVLIIIENDNRRTKPE